MKKAEIGMAEAVRECLRYEPETGIFMWKKSRNGVTAGMPAGYIDKRHGYVRIMVNGTRYRAGRLAWVYTYGHWPENEIDHIDGNPSNDRIANLRDVTSRQNKQNKELHRNGRLVGCYVQNKYAKKPWLARIQINGRNKSLGCFTTEPEAHEAYLRALENLGENIL